MCKRCQLAAQFRQKGGVGITGVPSPARDATRTSDARPQTEWRQFMHSRSPGSDVQLEVRPDGMYFSKYTATGGALRCYQVARVCARAAWACTPTPTGPVCSDLAWKHLRVKHLVDYKPPVDASLFQQLDPCDLQIGARPRPSRFLAV